MKRENLDKAKIIITVESVKGENIIRALTLYDNRIQKYRNNYLSERNAEYFLDMEDMKQTLNWNFNGDDSKYYFKWGQTVNGYSTGVAYIFD